jgi:hypothetical protein
MAHGAADCDSIYYELVRRGLTGTIEWAMSICRRDKKVPLTYARPPPVKGLVLRFSFFGVVLVGAFCCWAVPGSRWSALLDERP